MHPESRVLWGCSAPPGILPRSPQLCQNGGISVLFAIGEQRKLACLRDDSHVYGKQITWWGRKGETVRYRDATTISLVAKVRGEILAQFDAVAVKHHSSLRNWLFDLPGIILCDQSPWRERKLWDCFDFALHFSRSFRSRWVSTFRVRLMHSYPNPCLINARVSVPLFPRFEQNLMHTCCQIHREIAAGQMNDSK
jgi:hypothetical protein